MTPQATRGAPVLLLLGLLLALYLLAPFAASVPFLFDADWHGADLAGILSATLVSVAAATTSTLLVTLGGVPLGFLLARADRARPRALFWRGIGLGVQLPLALPPLSSGVLLLFLIGYASPLGRLSGGRLTDSFVGIVLAEAFVSAPFLIVAARSAFRSLDPALLDVAATLGHAPAIVFRRVALPLCARGILAGAVLAWLRGFGEFGATAMVAYHPYSLPVFTYLAFGTEGLPAMLPVIAPTLLAALAALALLLGLERARPSWAVPAPADPAPLAAAPAGAAAGPAPALILRAGRQLDGFALAVEWRSTARRLAVLGASGSGKTMTLRVLAGLEPGAVRIGARDLGCLPPQERPLAYVPQSFGLFPHLPVGRQIAFAADSDPTLARHWSERLGLDALSGRRPDALSLGQQQRVALARALSRRDTRLLLLDEPFSALDATLRRRLGRDLLALQAETGLRTILVTHDPEEAMLLADELLLLDRGRVLQSGPVAALFARPVSEQAARLLGAVATARGVAIGPDRIAIGADVALRVSGAPLRPGPVGWAVRPYQLRVGPEGDYPATLLERGDAFDGQRRLRIRLGDAELDALADPDCPRPGLCRVSIDPEAIQVWSAG
ncbi:ATP-binding cassette domain-containing protein [Acetobacteraceae bacterium KSS8]|uniref:ATP-binding cassette domain-containing protein n=1 Tax=Endosaccharibacter trunci TaxID=2812733 RepID=A0ABT1WE41_9PROT|nr:ATP-binding cassette domain-containing protein [Acetobacteraceae bacterium KSS8]